VITDMLMPGCDGLEFIAEIHRRHPQLRILAMTGGGRIPSEHYLKMARALGAHSVMEKPFSQQELLTGVTVALGDIGPAVGT
jgi:DNA-binding NtrC family response regulator